MSPARVADSFEAAQETRTLNLSSTQRRIVAHLVRENAAFGQLMDARHRAITATRRLENRLSGPEGSLGQVAPVKLREVIQGLLEHGRELDRLEAKLGVQFPKIASLMSMAPVPVGAAQRLLGDSEALVVTLEGRRETHVWVLTRKKLHYHRAPLGAEELAGIVDRLRASLDPRRNDLEDGIKPYPLELSAQLYRQLFAPARSALKGMSHVFYAPEGALRSLPLSVLVVDLARVRPGSGGTPIEGHTDTAAELLSAFEFEDAAPSRSKFAKYREVVWFIDKYSYSTIPSVNALNALRHESTASRAGKGFIGIGVPKLADRSKFMGLPRVPEAATSLRAMARTFGAGEEALYIGQRARESAVRALALNQYRTIAFAAPGVVAGEIPGVAEPALVLTPPDRASKIGDGLLMTSEIAQLKLDADLVVLGAAGEGLPEGAAGADWVFAFARAFIHAGARSLMMASWPVERKAAAAFNGAMFARRADGEARSLAQRLQHSALDLLNDDTQPARFAHPRYWGAFTILGDGAQKY